MAILFLDFFGSDPSKMDQTCKFGEQTSRILEFKPEGLDFYYNIFLIYLVFTGFALSFSRWCLQTLMRNSFLIFHSRETSSWKAWLLWEAAMDTTRQKSNCSRIGHIWHLMMLRVNLTRFVVFVYQNLIRDNSKIGWIVGSKNGYYRRQPWTTSAMDTTPQR